jgi:hypothetical protein
MRTRYLLIIYYCIICSLLTLRTASTFHRYGEYIPKENHFLSTIIMVSSDDKTGIIIVFVLYMILLVGAATWGWAVGPTKTYPRIEGHGKCRRRISFTAHCWRISWTVHYLYVASSLNLKWLCGQQPSWRDFLLTPSRTSSNVYTPPRMSKPSSLIGLSEVSRHGC